MPPIAWSTHHFFTSLTLAGRIKQRLMEPSSSLSLFAAESTASVTTSLNSTHSACREKIVDVKLKGSGDNQKIFVTLERRVGTVPAELNSEDEVRRHLDEIRNCGLIERRDLVFMRPSSSPAGREAPPKAQTARQSMAKSPASPGVPDYFIKLVPSQSLLFRFSALTFNAHHIHLDKAYCREVEGHRNLLVHGPLSCVMMLETLRMYLDEHRSSISNQVRPGHKGGFAVQDLVYRNLAPVYAEEEMRVCLRFKERVVNVPTLLEADYHPDSPQDLVDIDDLYVDSKAEGVEVNSDNEYALFDCWVENSEGRMCVRGTAYCRLINDSNTE